MQKTLFCSKKVKRAASYYHRYGDLPNYNPLELLGIIEPGSLQLWPGTHQPDFLSSRWWIEWFFP